jgi:exodeoxyribonuclease V alpha subunit
VTKWVAGWLNAKLQPSQELTLFDQEINRLIDAEARAFTISTGMHASTEQKAAVELVFRGGLCVVTGGAGTGKTTVLLLVHRVAALVGRPVMQMCLSGRATKRLAEATGRPAFTIARFLRSIESLITSDSEPVVVIDECSMVDLPTFYLLAKALPPRASIVLVGDAAQLPPIGFGLIFHLLSGPQSKVPSVELTRVYRQDESTGIPVIAHNVRHGITPAQS